MTRAPAYAKINLALVVGPLRGDGKHEVLTVLQQVDLHDDVELEPAERLDVHGFAADTIVREALVRLADEVGVEPGWTVTIEKRIPIAAGLGGGSSDAAAALTLANALLAEPLTGEGLHRLAAGLGADVPFFLGRGPRLGAGDGSQLTGLELPGDYVVVLALVDGEAKPSTAAVYRRFEERGRAEGYGARREALVSALGDVETARDLARLPRNDLASSPLADELERLGAFRADVSGAGPIVYGLFGRAREAEAAVTALRGRARTWIVRPLAAG